MKSRLILVASYPKSGNTWVRLVFDQLLRGSTGNFSMNQLHPSYYGFSRRRLFDTIVPMNAADLLPDEIDCLLPQVFHQLNDDATGPTLVKVHDKARKTAMGDWLFPPDCVQSVIYLTRHPFDIAVSYAHHLGFSNERTVDIMAKDSDLDASVPVRLSLPLHPQHTGSWSENVATWLGETPYPVTFARYEDLHAAAAAGLLRLTAAAGLAANATDIERVVTATQFERLQQEERQHGFIERAPTAKSFFRAGRPRSWEGVLDAALRERLVKDHGPMMRRLGYQPDGGIASLETLPS